MNLGTIGNANGYSFHQVHQRWKQDILYDSFQPDRWLLVISMMGSPLNPQTSVSNISENTKNKVFGYFWFSLKCIFFFFLNNLGSLKFGDVFPMGRS